MSTALQQLAAALEAAAPGAIFGVDANRAISFTPEATAKQRADAQALADGFDLGDEATAARHAAQLRELARSALDNQKGELITIQRAAVLELLDYENNTRQAFNALLTWLGGQAGLTNRVQLAAMQRTLATPAEARTAIKNRISAGEGD